MSAVPAGAGRDESSWVESLRPDGPDHDDAVERLHAMMLRVARSELFRRQGRTPVQGVELDDLAHQAAADATMAVLRKVDQFRGESRFTTWAYKFVVLEVSSALGRHYWRNPTVPLGSEDWERFPDRIGVPPEELAETAELAATVRRTVASDLTDHQREVFVAIVLDAVPLDALVIRLGTNRNAIYKTLFDARRKIRAVLVANGQLPADPGRRPR